MQLLFVPGIRSVAVSLMHSYAFPDHEKLVGSVARQIGFDHVSLSSQLMPMVKIVPRSYTGLYLTLLIYTNMRTII